jgi:hypothetical protein
MESNAGKSSSQDIDQKKKAQTTLLMKPFEIVTLSTFDCVLWIAIDRTRKSVDYGAFC